MKCMLFTWLSSDKPFIQRNPDLGADDHDELAEELKVYSLAQTVERWQFTSVDRKRNRLQIRL